MVEPLPEMPDGTLGFRIGGELTGEDYRDVVLPPVEAKIKEDEELRLLAVVDEMHAEPSAIWEGLKADVDLGIRHRGSWKRVAIVSDVDWVRKGSKLAGLLGPGDMKVFKTDELDEARAWTAG